jgi:hypothetical protein
MSEQVAGSVRPKKARQKRYKAWYGPAFLSGGAYQDGSLLANRLGLQLARIATQNTTWRLRKRPVDTDLAPFVEIYERDGVVAIENFLEPEVFAAVQAECRKAHEEGGFKSEVADDNSVIEERLGLKKHGERVPTTVKTLTEHEWLLRLAAAILRRPSVDRLELSVDVMTKSGDAPAPERIVGTNYLHADVHYPSGKAWLYLNDIDEENGALIYAKGSHRMTLPRLGHEYDASVRTALAKRAGTLYTEVPGNAARMPTEKQLQRMGIRESSITGKANTLVFVNVMGFHRRGEFLESRRREQIQIRFHDRPQR